MGNGIVKYLKFIWNCFLSVVYSGDDGCIICGEYCEEDKYLCSNCERNIKFCRDSSYLVHDGISIEVYSIAYYSKVMKELILKLKYKKSFSSGEAIVYYMEKVFKEKNLKVDLITYVPSSKKSLKRRGYNQSQYLAELLGECVNIPVIDCLQKVINTKDQIGLGLDERWENVKNSFKLKEYYDLKNKKILIIDDVITTGATSFYCAYELLKNGAGLICILTAAKSGV